MRENMWAQHFALNFTRRGSTQVGSTARSGFSLGGVSLYEGTFNIEQDLLGLAPNISPNFDLLHVSVHWVETTALMELIGEVVMSTVPRLHDQLVEFVPCLSAGLVVDLSLVTFLDSTGLAFLVAAHNQTKSKGSRLIVYAPTRQIRRLIEISGLTPLLEIIPTEPDEIVMTH
jgi:anti-sigma B factor antagonist